MDIPPPITSLINTSAAFAMLFAGFVFCVKWLLATLKENKQLLMEKADLKQTLIDFRDDLNSMKVTVKALQDVEVDRENALKGMIANLDSKITLVLSKK